MIETTNFVHLPPNEGLEHFRGVTGNLRLTERMTRIGPNTIDWRVTLDDPSTWTKAWTYAMPLTRMTGRNGSLPRAWRRMGAFFRDGGQRGHSRDQPSRQDDNGPGSSLLGPNGLEISRDGRWLYVGAWGSQSVVRLSRGQTPVKKDSVPVGFRVDNVRWAPDGTLLAAGQGGTAPSQASHIARVNLTTTTSRELVRYPFGDVFRMGTVAIQVGREIWVGTYHGNRIAIFATQ